MLRAFDEDRPAMGLGELARVMNWNKASVRRTAETLRDLGFLDKRPDGRYTLGTAALDLGYAYLKTLNLPAVAEPFMQEAVRKLGESMSLSILDGSYALNVGRIATTPRVMSARADVGSRHPAHASAVGKALLADADEARLVHVLGPPPWPALTEHTRTDVPSLLDDLRRARETSLAMSDEELEIGMRSIATPIRDASGSIVAALSIATNPARTSRETLMTEIAETLLDTGRRLSAALGYRDPARESR